MPGVTATAVGYEGGQLDQPTYREVCTDSTGHAEVVELDFDPSLISYEQLLDAFFTLHDPTTLNRQGPDWGTQYRSAIFFHSEEQQSQAIAKIEQLTAEGRFKPKRIVTKVEPAQTFWRAEDYHQRYLEKRGTGIREQGTERVPTLKALGLLDLKSAHLAQRIFCFVTRHDFSRAAGGSKTVTALAAERMQIKGTQPLGAKARPA